MSRHHGAQTFIVDDFKFSSVGAALKDSPDIALGNVVGSNIANILLIIGISALINPMSLTNKSVNIDLFVMMVASIMLLIFVSFDFLNFIAGLFFLTILLIYLFYAFKKKKPDT